MVGNHSIQVRSKSPSRNQTHARGWAERALSDSCQAQSVMYSVPTRVGSSLLLESAFYPLVETRRASWAYFGGHEGVRDNAAPHESPTDDVRAEVVLRASGKLLASQHPRASSGRRDSTASLLLYPSNRCLLFVGVKGRRCFRSAV